MTEYQTLTYEVADGVALLTLNRPEQLNAFTVQMADDLVAAFERAGTDDAVGAVVLTGAGRAFCAGMDLDVPGNVFGLDETQRPTPEDMAQRLTDPQIDRGVRDTGGKVSLAVFECPKPVIAAINGPAVGVGATMTLAMDARLMSTRARFGLVFGKLGIVPEACSTWFLPRIVGIPTAIELVLSAEILNAERTLEYGLVRSIHEPEDLVAAAVELARTFSASRSQAAVALARKMLYRNSAQPHPKDAHAVESLAMFYTSIGDGKEGVAAFLEKRPAEFSAKASDLPTVFP